MGRRRRDDLRENPASRHERNAGWRPAAAEREDEEAPSAERAAAAVGNRGFGAFAQEGEGILAGGRVHPDVEAAIAASRGRGRPLEPSTRARVAPRIGDDLADVRVHDDPEAAGLARAVSARAFAVGTDVFFGAGEHRPGTAAGDGLIAHELTHVAQQRGAPAAGPLTVSQPGDRAEREADAAASGVLQRAPKGKAQTITFGDDEAEVVEGRVHELALVSGSSAEKEIEAQVGRIKESLRSTQIAIGNALDQFGSDQSFAASDEGEADFDGAFLSWATEQILGAFVGQVGERLPYFGQIYGLTFGLIGALKAEEERAEKARGSRAVAEFLAKHRASVTNDFNAQIDKTPAVTQSLIVEYRKMSAETPELSRPTAPTGAGSATGAVVTGAAAEFLTNLRKQADALKPPTFEDCLQTFVEAWIAQSAGELKSRGGGDLYMDGRILISMGIMKVGESYTVTDKPKGQLQTPRASHVIDSLAPIFAKGKTTNDIGVLKVVTIRVEDEIDWDFNDWYEVKVSFYKRGEIESIETMGHPVREERVHRRAPAVQARVLKMVNFEDLALTKLTAAKEGR